MLYGVTNELNKYYQNKYSRFSPQEKNILAFFTKSNGTHLLYDYMLNNKNKDIHYFDKIIKVLKSTIRLCRLPIPLTVYRGTCFKDLEGCSKIQDNMLINKYFMSTSLDYDVANNFRKACANGIVMAINLPKGYPALFLKPVSEVPEEEELLLLPNEKFINIDQVKTGTYSDTYDLYKYKTI